MTSPSDNGGGPEGRLYPVVFNVERRDPGVTRAELEAASLGGCDHAVVLAMLGEFGATPISLGVMSMNGKTGNPLEDYQVWVAWAVLAGQLAAVLRNTPYRAMGKVAFEVNKEARRMAIESRLREGGLIYGPDGRPT